MFSIVNYWDQYNISHREELKEQLLLSSVDSSSVWLTPGHVFLAHNITGSTTTDQNNSDGEVEVRSYDNTAYTPAITGQQSDNRTPLKSKLQTSVVNILKLSTDNEYLIVSGSGECEAWFYQRKTKSWSKYSEFKLSSAVNTETLVSAVINITNHEIIWCSQLKNGGDTHSRCNMYKTRFTKDESGCMFLMETPRCLIRNIVVNSLYHSVGGTVIWPSSLRVYMVLVAECVSVYDVHQGFLFSEDLTESQGIDFTNILIRAAHIWSQPTDKYLPLCWCLSKPGNFFHYVDSDMSLHKITTSGVEVISKLLVDIAAPYTQSPAHSYTCFIMTFVIGLLFHSSIIRMFDVKSGNLLQVFNFKKRDIPSVTVCQTIGRYPIVGFHSTSGVWTLKMQSLSQVVTVCKHKGVDVVELLQKCGQKQFSKHVLIENLHNYCQSCAVGDIRHSISEHVPDSGDITEVVNSQRMSFTDKILLTALYQQSKGILPARIQTDIETLITSCPDHSETIPVKMREPFLKFWSQNSKENIETTTTRKQSYIETLNTSTLHSTIDTITKDQNPQDLPSNKAKLELLAQQQPVAVLQSLCRSVGFSLVESDTNYSITVPSLLVYGISGSLRFDVVSRLLYQHRPLRLVGFVSCVQEAAQYSHIQSAFTSLSHTVYYDRVLSVLPSSLGGHSGDSIRARAELLIRSSREFPHSEAMDLYLHNNMWMEGVELVNTHRHQPHIANEIYYKLMTTACQLGRVSDLWDVLWGVMPDDISYNDVLQVLSQYLVVKQKPDIFVSDPDKTLTVEHLRTKLLQSMEIE